MSLSSKFQISKIDMTKEGLEAFKILKELREHLCYEDFLNVYQQAQTENDYELWGISTEDLLVGLIGYRVLWDFVHGKHLYVDDLVITKNHRSEGLGARLLEHAEKVAQKESCQLIRLCTGIDNKEAQRFYGRHAWNLRAVVFKKRIL